MKTLTRIVLLAGLFSMSCWTRSVAGATYIVTMNSSAGAFTFIPATLSIAEGDTVIWTNTSSTAIHVCQSGNGAPDGHWASDIVNPLATFSVTFTNLPPASYAYYCALHARFGMTGTVTVTNNLITPPSLENPVWTNGHFQFTVNGKTGSTYITEITQDFNQWTSIQTNVAPATRFTVSDPSAAHMSFYRVRASP